MKYKIEKNTVQETLIIPLFAKKLAMDLYPNLFNDKQCQKVFDNIEYDFEVKTGIKEKIGALMGATRQYDMVCCCKEYLNNHPYASVVNLGCGLDSAFDQIDNGKAKSYCVDFENVIEIRKKLLAKNERETLIACDLNDHSWMDQIDSKHGVIAFASGVFYYMQKEAVKDLICKMAEKFNDGKIVFDATTEKGIKNMQKTWLNQADIKVGTYFYLEDAEKEIKQYSPNIKSVVKKPYMTAYRPLSKDFGFIENLVLKYFDSSGYGQLIEVEFE